MEWGNELAINGAAIELNLLKFLYGGRQHDLNCGFAWLKHSINNCDNCDNWWPLCSILFQLVLNIFLFFLIKWEKDLYNALGNLKSFYQLDPLVDMNDYATNALQCFQESTFLTPLWWTSKRPPVPCSNGPIVGTTKLHKQFWALDWD